MLDYASKAPHDKINEIIFLICLVENLESSEI